MLAAKGSVRTVKNQWAFRVTNNHVRPASILDVAEHDEPPRILGL